MAQERNVNALHSLPHFNFSSPPHLACNSTTQFSNEVCLRGKIPLLFHMWKFSGYLFSPPTHFKSLMWIPSAAETVTA